MSHLDTEFKKQPTSPLQNLITSQVSFTMINTSYAVNMLAGGSFKGNRYMARFATHATTSLNVKRTFWRLRSPSRYFQLGHKWFIISHSILKNNAKLEGCIETLLQPEKLTDDNRQAVALLLRS
jgi:hypothetical protein